jgi:membrane-associated phospholipid phosphatase
MDVIAPRPANSFPTPGTPRHPAYPSGHSTYSAAAAFTLIAFFPQYAEDLLRLADNTGVARLWAGVHWRSDHTFGQLVGRAVAKLIINQLIDAKIVEEDPTVTGTVAYCRPISATCAPDCS